MLENTVAKSTMPKRLNCQKDEVKVYANYLSSLYRDNNNYHVRRRRDIT